MTFLPNCDLCGGIIEVFSATSARCINCGQEPRPLEDLTPEQRRRRFRLIQRDAEIQDASDVPTGGFL